MANPKIYYANLGSYVIAASVGSDASHPTINLQDYIRSSYWMSDDIPQGQSLTIDIGTAAEWNYAIIDNHNLAGFLITIIGADNASFTTDPVTVYSGNATAGTFIANFSVVAPKRYWKIVLGDSGTFSDAPYIGNLFLGVSYDLTFPYEYGAKVADSAFQSVVGRSLSGVKRASQAVGGTRLFEVKFNLVSDAAAAEFRTFHDTVRGGLRPFYFSPDGGTTLYYVSLTKDYNPVTLYRYGQNNIETLTMETADSEVV